MTWPNDLNGVLPNITAVLGVFTAMIAVIAGGYQASLVPRMKRRLEWAMNAQEVEQDPTRKRTLEKIVQDAHARLVAAALVPATWFWQFPVIVVYFFVSWGAVFGHSPSIVKFVLGSLVAGVVSIFPFQRAIRLVKERQRIAHCFANGREIGLLDVEKVGKWTARRSKESALAFYGGAGLGSLAGAVGWLSGSPGTPALVAFVAAAVLCRSGVTLLRDHFGDPTLDMP